MPTDPLDVGVVDVEHASSLLRYLLSSNFARILIAVISFIKNVFARVLLEEVTKLPLSDRILFRHKLLRRQETLDRTCLVFN